MTEVAIDTVQEDKPTAAQKQKSYFSRQKLNRFILDDQVSYIEHKPIDEGTWEAYQDLTGKIKLDRTNETTEVDMMLGGSRRFLLEHLVTGWNLTEANSPVPFSHKKLLELPPDIIEKLVKDINKNNPILGGEDEEEGKET